MLRSFVSAPPACRPTVVPAIGTLLLCATWAACAGDSPPTVLPDPDTERFAAEVYPVLLRDCAMSECHGEAHRFFRILGPGRVRLSEDSAPLDPATEQELLVSYQRTRSMLEAAPNARRSLLLRKPLALDAGGASHKGNDPFGRNVYWSKSDPRYLTIERWVLDVEGEGVEP